MGILGITGVIVIVYAEVSIAIGLYRQGNITSLIFHTVCILVIIAEIPIAIVMGKSKKQDANKKTLELKDDQRKGKSKKSKRQRKNENKR